jgi:TRAP-type C4-dicarboxylate transport system permease small subunit
MTEGCPETNRPAAQISTRLRMAAIVLRSLFIAILAVLTWRVSSPQSQTIWTVHHTPGDLIRLVLGLGACTWMLIQVFSLPKDAAAYRTWLYVGLAVVPFGLLLVVAVW